MSEQKLIAFNEWTPPAARLAVEEKEQQARELTVGKWLLQYHADLDVRASTAQTYQRVIRNRILSPLAPGDQVEDITRLKDVPLL